MPSVRLSAVPDAHRLAPRRATAILLLLLVAGGAILFLGQHASKRISVDVLELLPRDEQDPTIRLARQTVSGRFGRTLYIALHDTTHPDKAPTEAAALMAGQLRADPAFADIFTGLDAASKDRLQQWFLDRRLALRLPVWFADMETRWRREKPESSSGPDPTWLAAAAAADLGEFQGSSDALAYQERLPGDPLLLIPALLSVFGDQDKAAAGSMAGGALTKKGPDGITYALIQAETRGSQMEEAGQTPVFAALDHALKGAQAKYGSGVALRFTGVNKFASETREHGLKEVSILTWISLGLSFVLLLFAFRRVMVFAYLLLPIITATLWSMVVCFACFDRINVVAITFITVLVGVALDYGIYTLVHARQTAGGLSQALREIRLPLVAGCLTSVGGFIFMTLTNLPMLQQMGLAVALGLVFSLGIDFLYLPWVPVLRPVDPRGEDASLASGRRLELGGARFPLLALGSMLLAGGLVLAAHLQWSDDIRTLSVMSPALQDEQTFLRGLFGVENKQHPVLTFGLDLNAAFANLEKFNTALAADSTAPSDRYFNLGRLFPTAAQTNRCRDYFRAHPRFGEELHASLDKDFNSAAFAPFWNDWDAWVRTNNDGPIPAGPAGLLVGLREVLPLPLQFLWSDEQAGSAWLATTVSDPLYQKLPPAALAAPNTPIDQTQTINAALRRYRLTASQRAGVGLALITVAVLAIYGWRRGVFMLVIPALSILLTLAVLGFLGQTLGLLHVVALLLGFCLASDYSIFLGSPGELPRSTHRAILLAATTALLSFGVLSFSKIQALKDICLTVTFVIAFVLVLCEAGYRLFVRRIAG